MTFQVLNPLSYIDVEAQRFPAYTEANVAQFGKMRLSGGNSRKRKLLYTSADVQVLSDWKYLLFGLILQQD